MAITTRIVPCLWFADAAEEAARLYTSIFRNSRITSITRYGEAGFEVHQRPAGSVMTVDFELDGQPFTALNGGPVFEFNEATSFQIICRTQEEIDYYWLKDRYGLSWQVVPEGMQELLADERSPGAERAMEAMLAMKKPDIAELRRAYSSGAG